MRTSAPTVGGGVLTAPSPQYEPIPNGYRFTWSPPEPWADGPHTVTFTVADRDGNTASVSAAYMVDTVPPELKVIGPGLHRVVDVDSWVLEAQAWDETSGVAGVFVSVNEVWAGEMVLQGDRYSLTFPLEVGENFITVTARDVAGQQTSEEVYMIRLVTDRTQADVDRLKTLYQRPVSQWTEEELEWFNTAVVRGAYHASDLNRVGIAVTYLEQELRKRGYNPSVHPKTDWTVASTPQAGELETYRRNVQTIRDAQNLPIQEIPDTMEHLDFQGANQLERALVETDSYFPRYTAFICGEIFCGEV